MKLLNAAETWEFDPPPKFIHTTLIFEHEGRYFLATSSERQSVASANSNDPSLVRQEIPEEHLFPNIPYGISFLDASNLTESDLASSYVKTFVLRYDGEDVSFALLHEARIQEILRNKSHPNIACYRGCITHNNRIRGICYKKYAETLADRLERGRKVNADACCSALRDALCFLHEQGFVHNDLGPRNVMFADFNSDVPILIDFDSCMPRGGQLPDRGSHLLPKHAVTSEPENDFAVLAKLQEYIMDEGHGKTWVQW